MKWARKIIGKLILWYEALFPPRPIQRSAEEQAVVDEKTRRLCLYEFEACPFCVKVRRAAQRLNLKLDRRDVLKSSEFEQELREGGGKRKVPCLRIQHEDASVEWMYESSDIVRYLEQRFSKKALHTDELSSTNERL